MLAPGLMMLAVYLLPKIIGLLGDIGSAVGEAFGTQFYEWIMKVSPALQKLNYELEHGTQKAIHAATKAMMGSGMLSWFDRLTGGNIGKEMLNVTESRMKAEMAMHKQIAAIRAKADQALKNTFILGTKQFDASTKRLEALFKVKPQIVKQSSIQRLEKNIGAALSVAKRGGVFVRKGIGTRLNEGDVKRLQVAQAKMIQFRAILAKSIAGKATGRDLKDAQLGLTKALMAYQFAAPQDTTGREDAMKNVVNPFFAMSKAKARRVAGLTMQQGDGRNLATGKYMKGLTPHASRYGASDNLGDLLRAGAKNTRQAGLAAEDGGRKLPGSFAQHLRERFKGRGAGGNDLPAEMLLEELKAGNHKNADAVVLLKRLTELTAGYYAWAKMVRPDLNTMPNQQHPMHTFTGPE